MFFSDLPEVKTVTIQIYKEVDGKNKKEKRKPVGKQWQHDYFLPIYTKLFLGFCFCGTGMWNELLVYFKIQYNLMS